MILEFLHLSFCVYLIVGVVTGNVCPWGLVQVKEHLARLLPTEIQRESVDIRAVTAEGFCYYFFVSLISTFVLIVRFDGERAVSKWI